MDLLETGRNTHKLTIMYKFANNLIDVDKHACLQASHIRNTRNYHTTNFITYLTNTDSYNHSFFPHSIRSWNRPHHQLYETETIETFINEVHKHLSNMTLTKGQTKQLRLNPLT